MPSENDWRAPPDEAGGNALAYSDIAFGYVSRNERYRAAYRRALDRVKRGAITADEATTGLLRRWGISYHAEPASAFDPKLVVTRLDLSPGCVVLAPPPSGMSGTLRLDMKMLGAIRARIRIGGLLHLILADKEGDEHLWVSGPLDRPLVMMLPFGSNPFAGIACAERFCRRVFGMASGPPALRPPPGRRQHLLTLLRALDGHQAGASPRELAAVLIDRDVRKYSAGEWSDCRQRKRINRWLAEAIELRDGGYIRLLRGG